MSDVCLVHNRRNFSACLNSSFGMNERIMFNSTSLYTLMFHYKKTTRLLSSPSRPNVKSTTLSLFIFFNKTDEESEDNLSTKHTQCVPLFGCELTMAELVDNLSYTKRIFSKWTWLFQPTCFKESFHHKCFLINSILFNTLCKFMLLVALFSKMKVEINSKKYAVTISVSS